MSETTLTVVNSYALTGAAEAFSAAVAALAGRVEREGHPGVRSYRFFLNAQDGSARAVIDYADPSAWLGHHDISMGWPEMQALHRAATLRQVTFLGPVTDEITAWLAASRLTAVIDSGFDFTVGFRRT